MPGDVPFYVGSTSADRALVDAHLRRAEDRLGIMHFAGSIVVPELVERPLEYYRNNTLASHALISAAVRMPDRSARSSSPRPRRPMARPTGCRSPRTTPSSRSTPMAGRS